MREILFRAKMKTDNGEYKKGDWVFGDLVRIKDGEKTLTMIYGFGEVDPETIGQYTGLTDKNGKKIFEGDIVKVYLEIPYLPSQTKKLVQSVLLNLIQKNRVIMPFQYQTKNMLCVLLKKLSATFTITPNYW